MSSGQKTIWIQLLETECLWWQQSWKSPAKLWWTTSDIVTAATSAWRRGQQLLRQMRGRKGTFSPLMILTSSFCHVETWESDWFFWFLIIISQWPGQCGKVRQVEYNRESIIVRPAEASTGSGRARRMADSELTGQRQWLPALLYTCICPSRPLCL